MKRPVPVYDWTPERAEQWAYMVGVAARFEREQTYPLCQINTRLVLALAKRVKTLESSNQALRQMREKPYGAVDVESSASRPDAVKLWLW